PWSSGGKWTGASRCGVPACGVAGAGAWARTYNHGPRKNNSKPTSSTGTSISNEQNRTCHDRSTRAILGRPPFRTRVPNAANYTGLGWAVKSHVLLSPRSQTPFGNAGSGNSVSRASLARETEFPAKAFPNGVWEREILRLETRNRVL